MADNNVNSSTEGNAALPAAEVSNAAPPEPKRPGLGFMNDAIRRAFGRAPREEASAADGEPKGTGEPAEKPKATERADDGRPAPAESDQPFKVFKTESEFKAELARAAQAEADRREQKRKADELKKQRAELREKDPYKFAELDRKQEAEQAQAETASKQVGQMAATMAAHFDRKLLDPIVLKLDEATRSAVLKDAPAGLEGRAQIMAKALDAVLKQARKEGEQAAEAKLRKNPAFRKELLAELRGSEEEPDLAPAAPRPVAGHFDMNKALRAARLGAR